MMPTPPGAAVMGQASHAPTGPAPFVPATDTRMLRFRKVSVVDRPDMIGGEAMTFLCPADWQVEGGMVWREHPAMPATVHLRVFNPRGLEQVESFPTLGFSYGGMLGQGTLFPIGSNYMGNEVRPPAQTAVQYLKEIIWPRYRAGVQAQIIGEQDMPQWAQAVAGQEEQVPGIQTQFSAGRVRVAYALSGHAVEEDLYCVLRTVLVPAGGNLVTQAGERVHGMRASRGQLDQLNRVMQTIVTSVQVNLQWFNKYTQLCQVLHQIQMQRIKTAGRISQIISQTHNEINDMIHQTWQNRQASEDRIHKQWTQTIRGVEEYYNPVERRPVELPSGYREAWINGLGEYILTDNPNLNPNVEVGGNWQRLQRQR
jgi:hypothetical protein